MSFADLGLSEPIQRAISERGYTEPTPIQQQAIPAVLSGRDLLAGAQTGTGKTAGFTLPLLQRLSEGGGARPAAGRTWPVRCLILTPTRELAAQVEESVRAYGKYLPLESAVIFGGVGIQPQIARLRSRVDILVATPGRLLDHAQQKTVDLSAVEILVLDEADRMLDMGFIHDIKRVLALLPGKRQNLLFSATFPEEIRQLANRLLDNPAMVEVARRNATTELVDQHVIFAEKGAKRALLAHLIRTRHWSQVLVFTRTKHGANRLAEQLSRDGLPALAIHGNKSQGARTRALAEFKDGRTRVLVATEIAARGLDIVELPIVVNYELPNVPEDYVHRIGRTGRAGAAGEAYSLVAQDEKGLLADIEKLVKREIPREVPADFDMKAALAASAAAKPAQPDGPRPSRGQQTPGRRARDTGGGGSPKPAAARSSGTGAGADRTPGSRTGKPRPDGQRPQGSGRGAGGGARRQEAAGGAQGATQGPKAAQGTRSTRDSRPAQGARGGGVAEGPRRGGARPAQGSNDRKRARTGDGGRPVSSGTAGAHNAKSTAKSTESIDAAEARNGRLKGALAQALTLFRRLG
ncbi:MAG: DEAD/DEAH box helicase [Betaproteobacteria bacterium]|nr:DEAD/DEAH box helicase [Betaproteobacteria bacterium]